MQDQWEYKTIWRHGTLKATLKDAEGTDYGPFTLATADELLNGLGKKGWEVCSLVASSLDVAVIVLKRRIAPA